MNRSIKSQLSSIKGITGRSLAIVGIGSIISALSMAPTIANAQQSTNATPKPLRIQLGIGFPASGHVTDATDNTDFSGGLSYDLLGTKSLTGPAFRGGLYGDFATIERHSNQFTTIGGGIQGRAYLTANPRAYQPYLGLGVGAYSVKYKVNDAFDKTDTKVGGKVAIGLDTPSGFFAEANYTLIDKVNVNGDKVDPSGTNLAVGYKF